MIEDSILNARGIGRKDMERAAGLNIPDAGGSVRANCREKRAVGRKSNSGDLAGVPAKLNGASD
jgi:hypothetical protein